LGSIKYETAVGYLKEIARKYKPGSKIANVPSTDKSLLGKELEGKMILEVPVQSLPVPKAVLDRARDLRIQIRDVEGRNY
jgi:hypothetical protein